MNLDLTDLIERRDLNSVKEKLNETNINAKDIIICTVLHIASRCSNVEIVKLLIELGAYINVKK